MSGEIQITPGYTFGSETDPVTTAKLNRLGQPTGKIAPGAVGLEEVDQAALLPMFANTVGMRNHFADPAFLRPWQGGSAGVLTISGTNAQRHFSPHWFCRTATGEVSFSRGAGEAGDGRTERNFSAVILGSTTATGEVVLGQMVPAAIANGLRGDVTVSAWILNGTGSALTPKIRVARNATLDVWAVPGTELSLTTCAEIANTSWVRVSATIPAATMAGWTNLGGYVEFVFPAGSLDAASKSVKVRCPQMELGIAASSWIMPEHESLGTKYLDKVLAPTVNEDWRFGYRSGDLWWDSVTKRMYVCTNAEPAGGAAWVNVSQQHPTEFLIMRHETTSNTPGQGLSASVENLRIFSHQQTNGSWATFPTSTTFTLTAGTYLIEGSIPAYKVGAYKVFLKNVTDGAYQMADDLFLGVQVAIAGQGSSAAADATQTEAWFTGRFTITETKTFAIDHRVTTTNTTNGGGFPTNLGASETYGFVKVTRFNY